ncbi:alpha/beta fold hydrolase [Kineococcus sp. SYSU DK002]|uniref:alpha/beta fold hydrolase n=1 Tax=Kineococcus sp. SYSU DK002 TaxID=3383123 RepID=UPI003D7F0A87
MHETHPTRRAAVGAGALAAVAGFTGFTGFSALGAPSAVAAPVPAPASPSGRRPTIVLVHGAFADGSSWGPVLERLHRSGYPALAVANPLRGVRSDADALQARLATLDGPVVLVGHSYGGAVITNVAARPGQVRALVYVAAFAPAQGESAAQLAAQHPGSTLGQTLAPVPLPDGSQDLYIRPALFHRQFAADVPAPRAALMAATQRPVRDTALEEASGRPAWADVPSWFLLAGADRNIPLRSQRSMAQRAGSRATVTVEGASHSVAVSHPGAVVQLITRAAS